MFGFPKDFKSKNITVKIDTNVKRRTYGDSSPSMPRKKLHSSVNKYDGSSDERGLSEYVRSSARMPQNPRVSRYSEIEQFDRSRDLDRLHATYKVLCVSALHPKASDEQVKDTLYREYRKFGEFSVKISHELNERMAYVCFRSSKDAKDAKHSKPRIHLFDKIALVAPVYESRGSRDHHASRARRSQSRNFSPDVERYYPASTEVHRPHQIDRLYEKVIPYGILPSMRRPQVFREIGLPPLHARELPISRQQLLHHMAPIHPHLGPIHALYGPPRHLMLPFKPYIHPHLMYDKKDKFPNYLHHIPPEDDPLATRTLFAGNLEFSITDEELYCLFGRYGVVEDIDIKRPLPGTGNAYAFVRYQNLDMAHRAKVELSGQYLGKFQCKIGYGKSIPSQRIWVGGLGPWTSLAQLEQEFDRFGVINKIEFVKGDIYAYIQFECIDAATVAVNEMRGVSLGGPEHKLRTDYAKSICGSPTLTNSTKSSQDDVAATAGDLQEQTRQNEYPFSWADDEYPLYSSKMYRKDRIEYSEESGEFDNHENRSFKKHSVSDISSSRSPLHQSIDSDVDSEEGEIQSPSPLDSVRTLEHLACKCSYTWQGSLVLKSSQFPTKCHLTSGDTNVIKSMMKDFDGKSILRITQRLRLDETKLEDVSKRMTADKHAIFLAMPFSTNSISNNDALVQIRPLRNLISYLKQKEAAGVISLISEDPETAGVLYVFPPCEYSAKLLKQSAKNLSSEALNDDHLVVVVVKGDI
ncbi:RNA-binding protein spenito-like [Metopolophium dirhodum]|uniref:RNA-binding protein spenito-like n=1 Tax=Metopolophium dirhodum TaxID=44670 RepID=UPI00298FF11F|nr:RNA-binding protein spenito-like [Metopolophium dirhodum]